MSKFCRIIHSPQPTPNADSVTLYTMSLDFLLDSFTQSDIKTQLYIVISCLHRWTVGSFYRVSLYLCVESWNTLLSLVGLETLKSPRPWCHMKENHWPSKTIALLCPLSVHPTKVDSVLYSVWKTICLKSRWVTEPMSAGRSHRENSNMHHWASVPYRVRLELAPLLWKVEETEFYRQTSGSRRLSTVCQSRRTRAQCHFTALRGLRDAGKDLGKRTETEGGERRRREGAYPNTPLPVCAHPHMMKSQKVSRVCLV